GRSGPRTRDAGSETGTERSAAGSSPPLEALSGSSSPASVPNIVDIAPDPALHAEKAQHAGPRHPHPAQHVAEEHGRHPNRGGGFALRAAPLHAAPQFHEHLGVRHGRSVMSVTLNRVRSRRQGESPAPR